MKFYPKLQTLLTANFVLVALCPIIAVGFITLHLLTKSLERETIQKNALLAKSLAGEIKRYLAEPRDQLAQIAHVIGAGGMVKSARVNDYLETAVKGYPSLFRIQILDKDGSVRHTAPVGEGSKNIDFLGQAVFDTVLKTGKPYLLSTFLSPQTSSPAMVMWIPFARGMVVGYISLLPLNQIMGGVKMGEKGYAAMTDRAGIIIAHSDPSFVTKRLDITIFPMVANELSGDNDAFHYDFRGEEMLGCVAVLPELGWQVMVMQPLEEAFAPVARMREILLGGILLTVILALGIAFFSLRKIVKPFKRLMDDAGKIARGDYGISSHEKRYPEIDALADNFRTMALSLKAREVALQQSEEKYRNLVEDSFDGIFILKGLKIVFVNQRLCEMLGYDRRELVGLEPGMIFHPDYRRLARERGLARLRGETIISRYEVKLQRKDGSWFFGETSSKVITLNGKPGIQAWISDLTDRKEAEAAVRKSEKRFRDLFNGISDLIYTQDLEGRFLSANPALYSLFGYDPHEFLGRKASEFMDPELRPYFESEYLETLRKSGHYEGTSPYMAKDGRRILVETHSTLVRPDDGEPYISGTGRDVTEKIQSKKQLKLLREQVVQAEKMKAVGVLAGGVAHDFNNLLMGVQGNASLMLLGVEKSHPHYQRLKNIEKYAEQGADLTRKLLGFARGGKYEVKPTDINLLLEEELLLFGRTHKELVIQRHFQENLRNVDADRNQIIQALLNLFINAWQAMPDGGELHVQTQSLNVMETESRFHGVRPGKFIRISVKDSGVGMDKATMERVFEPFFTTKEMGRGTGLGLASVYGTVKNHGGFVLVESEPGKGTTFKLHLPVSASDLKETVVKSNTKLFMGKGETILLVDDEEMVLEVCGNMLKKLGYRVITAKGGETAVSMVKTEKDSIALVILDMIMPGMGGGETYDRLKEIKTDINVLLASGYSIDGQARKILDRGCNGFIQKPFNLEKLSRSIRKVLRHEQS